MTEPLGPPLEVFNPETKQFERNLDAERRTATDCDTCGEGASDHDYCPKSHRLCHHHCNCIWTQDTCHWCGGFINDDGELIGGTDG